MKKVGNHCIEDRTSAREPYARWEGMQGERQIIRRMQCVEDSMGEIAGSCARNKISARRMFEEASKTQRKWSRTVRESRIFARFVINSSTVNCCYENASGASCQGISLTYSQPTPPVTPSAALPSSEKTRLPSAPLPFSRRNKDSLTLSWKKSSIYSRHPPAGWQQGRKARQRHLCHGQRG